jgi:hypothetical protein
MPLVRVAGVEGARILSAALSPNFHGTPDAKIDSEINHLLGVLLRCFRGAIAVFWAVLPPGTLLQSQTV